MRSAFQASPLQRLNLAICLLCLGVAIPWSVRLGSAWMQQTFFNRAFLGVCFAGLAFHLAGLFYAHVRRDACLARMLFATACLPVMIFTAVMLTYLVATIGMPMADARLAAIDAAIGFDFARFVTWAADQRLIRDWALIVYGPATIGALLLVMVYLVATNRADEFERYLAFLSISVVTTIVLAALLPAGSAFAFHHVPIEIERALGTVVGADYNAYYASIRAGDVSGLAQGPRGMVSFPSFHTVMGMMCVFYLRSNLRLMIPVAAVIGVMILTTPLIGGHFLADVMAGFAVSLLTYWLVDRLAIEAEPKSALHPQNA